MGQSRDTLTFMYLSVGDELLVCGEGLRTIRARADVRLGAGWRVRRAGVGAELVVLSKRLVAPVFGTLKYGRRLVS